jgi:exosortase/archaeosortase family protein
MDPTTSPRARIIDLVSTIAVAAAFWPVWVWYAQRTLDKSDEPWGVLALLTAIAFLIAERQRPDDECVTEGGKRSATATAGIQMLSVTALLLIYLVSYHVLPQLVQAMLVVCVIWMLFGINLRSPSKVGVFGLLLLSLPLLPSIHFFAGYPVRLIVAAGAKLLLSCMRLPVGQEATVLLLNGQPVSIDAPCSGINMLWSECFAAMILACVLRFQLKRTALLTAAGLAFVVLGNIARAVALILFDYLAARAGSNVLLQCEPAVHVAVGLFAFSATTAAAAGFAWLLNGRTFEPQKSASTRSAALPVVPTAAAAWRTSVLALCLCASVLPVVQPATTAGALPDAQPQWPSQINGRAVVEVESLAEERAFAADFPGHMKRFTDGSKSYFVRVVNKETRQLHPSSDCFKGLGYSIEHQPLVVLPDGTRWSSFVAEKGRQRYRIVERIFDKNGRSWTDVSEWYWHACFNPASGPWTDITVASAY